MSYPSNGPTESEGRTGDLTVDERHDLLSSGRRRRALDALAGRSTVVELATLAADVAARATATEADEAAVDSVALTLHHSHLPRLDDAGVVDYDPERRLIDPDPVLVESLTTGQAHF